MKTRTLFPDLPRPFIFAHRGLSSEAVENSMPAFDLARTRGFSGIELDVHICATGQAVVIHDSDLRRMTGKEGKVENLSWEEIQGLPIGKTQEQRHQGERIPLLEEVLSTFASSLYFDIELKGETFPSVAIVREVSRIIRTYKAEEKVLISSFNPFALMRWNLQGVKEIPTGIIYSRGKEVPRFLQGGNGRFFTHCDVLKPHSTLLEKSLPFAGRYEVVVWGDPIKQDIVQNVSGVITDFPHLIQ